jgi:hypothetical protein
MSDAVAERMRESRLPDLFSHPSDNHRMYADAGGPFGAAVKDALLATRWSGREVFIWQGRSRIFGIHDVFWPPGGANLIARVSGTKVTFE